MYDDTEVSVRYSLEDAAMLLDGSKAYVSVEVAALVALELCEVAKARPIQRGCVFVDITGQLNVSHESENDDLAAILTLWERAAHPKARPSLRAARESESGSEGWARVFADLLFPIERIDARTSLMAAITRVQSVVGQPPKIETLLSGLEDDVLDLRAPFTRPVLDGPTGDDVGISKLGRFDIFGRLASGSVTEVLLAREPELGPCVLKRLRPEAVSRPLLRQLFTDEAKLGLSLSHPHIAKAFEYHDEGFPLIVMEWAHGLTLAATLRQSGAIGEGLPFGVVLRVGESLCSALAYARAVHAPSGQRLQVDHRDISPENVVLQFDGRIKLLDFGVARSAGQTDGGEVISGTFGYMSPEESMALPIDDRSDVFCVGICLYESLSGRPLFPRDDRFGVVRTLAEGPVLDISVIRADVPPTFANLLAHMLDVDADERPTLQQVQDALGSMTELRTDASASHVANVVQRLQPSWEDWRARLPGGARPENGAVGAANSKADGVPPVDWRRPRWPWIMALFVCIVCVAIFWTLLVRPAPRDPADMISAEPVHP